MTDITLSLLSSFPIHRRSKYYSLPLHTRVTGDTLKLCIALYVSDLLPCDGVLKYKEMAILYNGKLIRREKLTNLTNQSGFAKV